MVEMPSIWCKRSPGAKKSEAGPYAFIDAMTGGNDKSVRSVSNINLVSWYAMVLLLKSIQSWCQVFDEIVWSETL